MLQRVFLFTVFSFLRICSSVKHASLCTHRHITVFMFLHVHTTFNQDLFFRQILFNVVCKASHAFIMNSVLDSWGTVWLDKVVYFTLEQTPKKWAVCYALLGKKLPQQNMLIKIKILLLKFISDSWGKRSTKFTLKAEKSFWTWYIYIYNCC